VLNTDGTQVVGTQSGSGSLSGNTLTLTGSFSNPSAGYSCQSQYSGTLADSGGSLRGNQAWDAKGKRYDRSCSVSLRRAAR
jgi:hypothetical protein